MKNIHDVEEESVFFSLEIEDETNSEVKAYNEPIESGSFNSMLFEAILCA